MKRAIRRVKSNKVYLITLLSAACVILTAAGIKRFFAHEETEKNVKVGFVYVGDASDAYTYNFMKAYNAIENQFKEHVEINEKYNVAEGKERDAIQELITDGCNIIFTTSYGYGETAKEMAQKYPDVEFCQATCANANEKPKVKNYHTFMGRIYEGRYASGVVAGMKLKELIDNGELEKDEAKIGYVGAYPYAEVISGYTAFFLGIRSVVEDATMTVMYTNSWSDYAAEKKCAEQLIGEGCVVISQHSDTFGPAVACEETEAGKAIYHVGYNQSMADVAPTTYLVGSKIDWEPYILSAVRAVLEEKPIEKTVKGNVNGNDIGSGFDEGWVEMLELNELIAAKGSKEKMEDVIEQLKNGEIEVFKGDYTGINPDDESDIFDLNKGYKENKKCSAPTFNYILKDVITVDTDFTDD